MNKTDSFDIKLASLLSQDARQSGVALAKQLGVSSATVRRRLRRLFDSDLLRIVGAVDPGQLGFPVEAMIALDVDHRNLELAMKELKSWPEVKWAATTTGRFDILVIAHFTSADGLSDFLTNELTKLDYVKDSETFICLKVKKGRHVPFY